MADETPRRPRRRPRLDPADRSVHVSVSLPSREHDRLCRVAHKHGVSLGEVLRHAWQVVSRRPDDDLDR